MSASYKWHLNASESLTVVLTRPGSLVVADPGTGLSWEVRIGDRAVSTFQDLAFGISFGASEGSVVLTALQAMHFVVHIRFLAYRSDQPCSPRSAIDITERPRVERQDRHLEKKHKRPRHPPPFPEEDDREFPGTKARTRSPWPTRLDDWLEDDIPSSTPTGLANQKRDDTRAPWWLMLLLVLAIYFAFTSVVAWVARCSSTHHAYERMIIAETEDVNVPPCLPPQDTGHCQQSHPAIQYVYVIPPPNSVGGGTFPVELTDGNLG
jgi:hypothetical protein